MADVFAFKQKIVVLSVSGPGSNGNKGFTSHSPELQNWHLTTGCSSMSYSKCYLERGASYPTAGDVYIYSTSLLQGHFF